MASQFAIADRPSTAGTIVRGPRITDAAGGALRRAFDTLPRVPADLLKLMRELDRID